MNTSVLALELRTSDFHLAAPVFASMIHHLAVTSILSGNTPARIFVDDLRKPSAALAWAGHRFHLAGSPDNDVYNEWLAHFFSADVVAHHHATGSTGFTVYYEPAG